MRFWLDTEFIEDGRTIDLISIGIVAEDGREYYAVSSDCDRSRANAWVRENVLPMCDWSKAIPRAQIRAEIVEFCGFATYDHKSGKKHQHEFWANYSAYDWVVLCQLFGSMAELPEGWPMYCHDLQQLLEATGDPAIPKQWGGHHHALSDAQWVREAWTWCTRQDPNIVARKVLDPYAEVSVTDIEVTPDIPEQRLLINPITDQAFLMRRDGQKRLIARKRILTSLKRSDNLLMRTPLLNYTTEIRVCSSMYLRAIRVSIGDGLTEEYMKRLWDAQFEFLVDGEPLIQKTLRSLIGVKEVVLSERSKKVGCLFQAHRASAEGPIWTGYMLPNGSRIQAELDKIPSGGGEVVVKISCDLGIYTAENFK